MKKIFANSRQETGFLWHNDGSASCQACGSYFDKNEHAEMESYCYCPFCGLKLNSLLDQDDWHSGWEEEFPEIHESEKDYDE